MYFYSYYYLVILGAVLCLLASARVKRTFAKYSKTGSMSGMTGAEAADRILRSAGIYDVAVQRTSGNLTDHYDPRSKTLNLSDSVFNQTSVAAIGVAAHECGHAIQHQNGYVPLRMRNTIVPVANFGSAISWPIILIGATIVQSQPLINFGIILFSLVVAFQLITLPVEFNASRRAVQVLGDTGILYDNELKQTKKVLKAAALTYVAGAAAMVLQLIRLIFLFGGRDRD